jgi:glutaredoxin
MAKEYFKDHNIVYSEKDMSTDREALEFVLEKVGQAVSPIITVNDEVIVGFDRPKIDEALKNSKHDNSPSNAADVS